MKEEKSEFHKAMDIFRKSLLNDKDLYRGYKANLAMAYYDNAKQLKSRDSSAKRMEIGNKAAEYFLWLLLKQ
jgi:hypothetical protein